MNNKYDIIIAGSGFAGSLMALILTNIGFKVCVIEKSTHPRFAIGESSTPIADMIIRVLSDKYHLPWLHDFSRYGTWKKSHPEISCGRKRGFSYYKHYADKEFSTDKNHTDELLVAASSDDLMSDTNWYRPDFDKFLAAKVIEASIPYFDQTEIVEASRENDRWYVFTTSPVKPDKTFHATFFIDATGGGHLLEKLFSVKSSGDSFLTDSFSIFSHFDNLPLWSDILSESGFSAVDYPYNPDYSALHHIIDEGWIWSLGFDNSITSWGLVLERSKVSESDSPEKIWRQIIDRYPGLQRIQHQNSFSAIPGKLVKSSRLQRKADRCYGEGWVALPHSIGFIDPLYSTGIAHSLVGIEKVASILSQYFSDPELLYNHLGLYQESVFSELKLIDLLVAGSYQAMADFRIFTVWSMIYFTLTIKYEQLRLQNLPTDQLLCGEDTEMQSLVEEVYGELVRLLSKPVISDLEVEKFTDMVREKIRPYNIAGLLDPSAKNMYWHTAADL